MSRFKTEMCNNLIELGNCKYGDRCHYAHGAHELRQVSRRHPKYRTEKCKNFETNGKCPFGPRCSYVHPKPDLDSMIEQLSKYMKYTKAPRPEESDDDDHVNFFAKIRTNTSRSISISTTSDSIITVNDNEENKENQHVINFDQNSRNNLIKGHLLVEKQLHPRLHNNHHLKPNNIPLAINNQDNTILQNRSHSSSSTATTFSSTFNTFNNADVSSQAVANSSSSIPRTPLGSNNHSNILSTPTNLMDNFQSNDRHNQQHINSTSISNANGTCSNNISRSEASTCFENIKRIRLNNHTDLSTSNSNNTTTASNPFRINNPLSDYLNNGRSPLNPKKQFYTRF